MGSIPHLKGIKVGRTTTKSEPHSWGPHDLAVDEVSQVIASRRSTPGQSRFFSWTSHSILVTVTLSGDGQLRPIVNPVADTPKGPRQAPG